MLGRCGQGLVDGQRLVEELVEMLVRAREHLLEDVLGIGVGQAECLSRDRVDVARKALDQLRPRLLIPGPAAGDELAVTQRRCNRTNCDAYEGWGQTPIGV